MGISLLLVMLVMPFMSFVAHAQNFGTEAPPAPTTGINEVQDVFDLVNNIFNILFWLLIVLASVFIIWAAFTYLTAGGDPEKVKTANHRVIYAAVAVVVAVLAKAIPSVICNFLATSCTDITA